MGLTPARRNTIMKNPNYDSTLEKIEALRAGLDMLAGSMNNNEPDGYYAAINRKLDVDAMKVGNWCENIMHRDAGRPGVPPNVPSHFLRNADGTPKTWDETS